MVTSRHRFWPSVRVCWTPFFSSWNPHLVQRFQIFVLRYVWRHWHFTKLMRGQGLSKVTSQPANCEISTGTFSGFADAAHCVVRFPAFVLLCWCITMCGTFPGICSAMLMHHNVTVRALFSSDDVFLVAKLRPGRQMLAIRVLSSPKIDCKLQSLTRLLYTPSRAQWTWAGKKYVKKFKFLKEKALTCPGTIIPGATRDRRSHHFSAFLWAAPTALYWIRCLASEKNQQSINAQCSSF